jgi:hypothetical protein
MASNRQKENTTPEVEKENETKTESAEKMVTVFIPREKGSNEASMFVSVNSRTFYVPIGVKVEVPECVANVIATSQEAAEEAYRNSQALAKD